MSRERYRINATTCATYIEGGKEKLATVPAGSLLEIRDLDVTGDTRAPELGDGWMVAGDTGWQTSENGLRYVTEELVRTGLAPAG